MAGCRRAREEQPCGPCRGALAFGFSHPGAASAPACPQTRFFGRIASHGATATAPPPDIVVASLWLAACCCLVSERDRSLVCLAPATALPPLDANKRMLEWMPGTKGWEQAQREQMPPSQTGADDADAAARGSSGARGDKRKREVTDGGRAPAVPFACLDASSPTPTRRATTPLRCANCQKLLSGFGWEEPGGGWLAVAGGACVHPYPCYYHCYLDEELSDDAPLATASDQRSRRNRPTPRPHHHYPPTTHHHRHQLPRRLLLCCPTRRRPPGLDSRPGGEPARRLLRGAAPLPGRGNCSRNSCLPTSIPLLSQVPSPPLSPLSFGPASGLHSYSLRFVRHMLCFDLAAGPARLDVGRVGWGVFRVSVASQSVANAIVLRGVFQTGSSILHLHSTLAAARRGDRARRRRGCQPC